MELTESAGKTMLATKVLIEVLRYLKEMILNAIYEQETDIEEEDVYWVLAVLGERCEDEKQFMEQAAIQVWNVLLKLSILKNNFQKKVYTSILKRYFSHILLR